MRTFKQFLLEMGKEEYDKVLKATRNNPSETSLERYKKQGGVVPCKDGRFYKKEGKPWCPEDEKPKS